MKNLEKTRKLIEEKINFEKNRISWVKSLIESDSKSVSYEQLEEFKKALHNWNQLKIALPGKGEIADTIKGVDDIQPLINKTIIPFLKYFVDGLLTNPMRKFNMDDLSTEPTALELEDIDLHKSSINNLHSCLGELYAFYYFENQQ